MQNIVGALSERPPVGYNVTAVGARGRLPYTLRTDISLLLIWIFFVNDFVGAGVLDSPDELRMKNGECRGRLWRSSIYQCDESTVGALSERPPVGYNVTAVGSPRAGSPTY